MRSRIAGATALIAAFAFSAPAVYADTSTLADGLFEAAVDPNHPDENDCFVVTATETEAGLFETGGTVSSANGTNSQQVTIDYHTPQPTSVGRNDNKIAVEESKFSALRVRATAGMGGTPAAFDTGVIIVQDCSVKGTAKKTSTTTFAFAVSVGASCSGPSISAPLTADQAASVQQAFKGVKSVKLQLNTGKGKWSLSIKCKATGPHP